MRLAGAAVPLASLGFCLALLACNGGREVDTNTIAIGSNPQRGKALIRAYGCGACHIIPGVRTARGLVGPPLFDFANRTIIAGEIPNTPPNLVEWIQNPKAVEPKTAMPDLGLSKEQATDVAAYLYTLRGSGGGQ
jgi:cytochrome c